MNETWDHTAESGEHKFIRGNGSSCQLITWFNDRRCGQHITGAYTQSLQKIKMENSLTTNVPPKSAAAGCNGATEVGIAEHSRAMQPQRWLELAAHQV